MVNAHHQRAYTRSYLNISTDCTALANFTARFASVVALPKLFSAPAAPLG